MIDATTNYINPYTNKFPSVAAAAQNFNLQMEEDIKPDFSASQTGHFIQPSAMGVTDYNSFYKMLPTSSPTSQVDKLQTNYPPQPSSTGSASPNSSMSASTSPSIFPSPSSSFSNSSSQSDFSTGYPSSWNAYAAAATIPTRPQFSYAQYPTTDYYSNGMSMAASAAAGWFPTWSSNSTYGFNFEDIAFQTQLQRRSVRCTCPNCTNEMSGLPPIVGPDERGRKQHICHIPGCERLYGKASHLKTHLRWHTGERPFLCLTCGKRFSRSDELQRHGRTHTNYRPYSCPICSKKFSRSDHLSKHKKTHFKDKSKKVKAEKESTSPKKDENANIEKKETPVAEESTPTTLKIKPANMIKSEFGSAVSLSNSSSPSSVSSVSSSATINTTQSGIPSGYTPYTPWFHQSHNPQNNLFSSSSTTTATTATPPQEEQLQSQEQLQQQQHQHQQQQQQLQLQHIHQPQTTSPEMMSHHHHPHHAGHHQHQFPSYPTAASAYGDYSTSTMGYHHPWTNFHATA